MSNMVMINNVQRPDPTTAHLAGWAEVEVEISRELCARLQFLASETPRKPRPFALQPELINPVKVIEMYKSLCTSASPWVVGSLRWSQSRYSQPGHHLYSLSGY